MQHPTAPSWRVTVYLSLLKASDGKETFELCLTQVFLKHIYMATEIFLKATVIDLMGN